jgi:hypothetical protein
MNRITSECTESLFTPATNRSVQKGPEKLFKKERIYFACI